VIAITMPITTKTMTATCIQIQVRGTEDRVSGARGPVGGYRWRMHGWRPRAAAALAAGAAAICGHAASAATPVHRVLGGINVPPVHATTNLAEADRAVAWARQLHVSLIRVDFPWSEMEPRAGQLNPLAFSYADRLVADAAAAGIGVSATVESTPCWQSTAPPDVLRTCRPGGGSRANSYPPADPSTYATFLARLAGRYRTGLAALEVWNEPDQSNEFYFAGPDKARRYTALVRAAYPAVKHVNPALPLLAGSLVGSNGLFLDLLYADGMKGFYDGLSVHFYNLTVASLHSIRAAQVAHGDSAPLWLDEFGWTSCWGHARVQQEQGCVTRSVQAADLRSSFSDFARLPYVAAAVVYKLQDSPDEDFGVLATDGARKPSFAALVAALTGPSPPVPRIMLHLRRSRGAVVASGSGPVGDFMVLEALRGAVPRYRAYFVLDRFNRYSLTLPRVLGSHGLTVRVFRYSTGLAGVAARGI
jgi:polysaccharide biosynthesis protein PslG